MDRDHLKEPFSSSPTHGTSLSYEQTGSTWRHYIKRHVRSPSELSWAQIKYYVLPVEMVFFLYVYVVYFQFQIYQQYYYQQTARNTLNLTSNFSECLNQTDIDNMSDNKTFATIQDTSKYIMMVTSIVSQIPSIPATIVVGGFADKFGRKPIMFLLFVGQVVQSIVCLVVIYFNLNMYLFLLGAVINGFTGGFGAALVAGYSYIADITPKRWLTVRSGLLEVFIFAGSTSGLASSNSWLGSNGCDFHPPSWLLIAVPVVGILYVAIIPESLTDERRQELALRPKKGLQAWITGIKIYFLPTYLGMKKYWKLLAATVCTGLSIINQLGFVQINTYFLENKPLEWSLERISLYSTTSSVVYCFSLVVLLPLMVILRFPDPLMTLIGVVFAGGVAVFFGFVEHSWPFWIVFIAGALQSLQAVIAPTLRSSMSKLVGPADQGAMFSFLSTIELMCTIASSAIFFTLYQSTGEVNGVKVSRSIAFWVMAAIWAAVVPFLLAMLVSHFVPCSSNPHDDNRAHEKEHLLAENTKKAPIQ